jgi:hypothetical protein
MEPRQPTLYMIQSYDPLRQRCTIVPYNPDGGPILTDVPLAIGWSGSWERQQQYGGTIGPLMNAEQWGNSPRGPVWGETHPIEPGDIVLVQFLGADAIITAIAHDLGAAHHSPAWVANQVHSSPNDFTKETPAADDEPQGRYDVLLPSGGWLRNLADGSWVVTTCPVDRPKVFMVLNADGSFKIKARNADQYNIHVEFDANTESGRICVGPSEGGSAIEFKDGNITIRAKKQIRLYAEKVEGDIRPQKPSAMDALIQMGTQAALASVGGPVAQMAGEMILGGAFSPMGKKGAVVLDAKKKKGLFSQLLNAPGLDAVMRGQISELLLNPGELLNQVTAGFEGLTDPLAIGQQLTGMLGAGALSGLVQDMQSPLDLGKIASTLGIPSWVAGALQGQVPSLPELIDIVDDLILLPDHALLNEVLQRIGGAAMGGALAPGAIAQTQAQISELPSALRDRIKTLLEEDLDSTPLLMPETDLETAAQRTGLLIAQGETMLGGKVDLFGPLLPQLEQLPNFQDIGNAIDGIEQYFSNPFTIVEDAIPAVLSIAAEQLDGIPPELRKLMQELPSTDLARFPELLAEVLDVNALLDLPGAEEIYRDLTSGFDGIANLLKVVPPEVTELLQSIAPDVFQALSEVPAVLEDPIGQLTANVPFLNSVFGATGLKGGAGLFDVRVSKRAQFDRTPKPPKPMAALNTSDEYHLQTTSAPITHVQEYGALEMPDYFTLD